MKRAAPTFAPRGLPNALETCVAELCARMTDVEARVSRLEVEAKSDRAFLSEATRRLDVFAKEMHQLSGAVGRLVDDAIPAKMLAERAARSAEENSRGIARILERLDDLHASAETTLTDMEPAT